MLKIEEENEIKIQKMLEILENALRNRSVVSICIGKVDWEKRLICYVKSVKKTIIIIDIVDIFGFVTQSREIKIDKILLVEVNDSYNKHLEQLQGESKKIKETKSLYFYNKGIVFYNKLESLRIQGSVCTIFFGTEFMTGIIADIRGNIVILNGVGYRGTMEGETYCVVEKITKIRYQGPLESKINFLKRVINENSKSIS